MTEQIFRFLVKHCVSGRYMSWHPLSAHYIAQHLGMTHRECIKHLHSLKEQGLVEVVRGGYYDDLSATNRLYCGWYITNKAHETKTYKEEYRKRYRRNTKEH